MRTKRPQIPDFKNCSALKNLANIPNEVIRNPSLSAVAKSLLSILLSNIDGWKSYKSSIDKYMMEGSTATYRGLKELEENGYIARLIYVDARTKRKVGTVWVYANEPYKYDLKEIIDKLEQRGYEIFSGTITKFGLDDMKNPRRRNPRMGDPHMENPHGGFHVTKNTNNKNTNNKNTNNNKEDFEKPSYSPSKDPEVFIENFPKEFRLNKSFRKTWRLYVQHRREKNSPLHKLKTSCTSIIALLTSKEIDTATAMLQRSIDNGWTGIFELPNKINRNTKPPNDVDDEPTDVPTKKTIKYMQQQFDDYAKYRIPIVAECLTWFRKYGPYYIEGYYRV